MCYTDLWACICAVHVPAADVRCLPPLTCVVCALYVQNIYRIMVRPCLGKQVFAKLARPAFEAHKKKDPQALAQFNKAIRGITFQCKVST